MTALRHLPHETPQPAPDLASAAAMLGLNLQAVQLDALLRFVELLARWNATYNLTAIRAPAQMLTHHILDCLAVVPSLRRRLGDVSDARVLDVGSGAGLPGVVLAIAEPALAVLCVDSVAKKAAFVRQAASELGLANLVSLHARVEDVGAGSAPFKVVTSRAFAALADFVTATRHLLAPDGYWLAMKGKAPIDEIARLPKDVEAFHVEQLAVPGLQADRCIVWMRIR